MSEQAKSERSTWRDKLALAAVTGMISGTIRAFITWVLHNSI